MKEEVHNTLYVPSSSPAESQNFILSKLDSFMSVYVYV